MDSCFGPRDALSQYWAEHRWLRKLETQGGIEEFVEDEGCFSIKETLEEVLEFVTSLYGITQIFKN